MTPWEEAEKIVCGARNATYGKPEDNFERIAFMWSGYIAAKTGVRDALDNADVARMMTIFKLARDLGPVPTRDNLVDSHGYLMCLGNMTGRNSESNHVDPVGPQYDPRDVALSGEECKVIIDGVAFKATAAKGPGRKRKGGRPKGSGLTKGVGKPSPKGR